jgi:hypothetical protein
MATTNKQQKPKDEPPMAVRVITTSVWVDSLGRTVNLVIFFGTLLAVFAFSRVVLGGATLLELLAFAIAVLAVIARVQRHIAREADQHADMTIPEIAAWIRDGAPKNINQWQKDWRAYDPSKTITVRSPR